MFVSTPVGRNYKVDDKEKYFQYFETIEDDKSRDERVEQLTKLGLFVKYEKSRSKKSTGWNMFVYNPADDKWNNNYVLRRNRY